MKKLIILMLGAARRGFAAALVGAAALGMAGCIVDAESDTRSGAAEVETLISLAIPGGFADAASGSGASTRVAGGSDSEASGLSGGSTRALSETQQKAVEEATLLVFNGVDHLSRIVNVATADIVQSVAGVATMEVTLPGGAIKLMVVANANALVAGTVTLGDSYWEVCAGLTATVSGKMFASAGDAIPMWGEADVVITESSAPTIDLVRAAARVDVGVGTFESGAWTGEDADGDAIPFMLTEVYLVSPSKSYRVVGSAANLAGRVPTLPSSVAKFTVAESKSLFFYSGADITGVAGGSTSGSIYAPEAIVKGVAEESRTALVVGGKYNGGGSTTYYRVDFENGSGLVDIVRNTLYRFSIASVAGPGADDPETAYQTKTINMEATIVDWNEEPMADVHMVGDVRMVLSENPVELGAQAGSSAVITIDTNVAGFEMTLGGETLTGGAAVSTAQTSGFDYTLTPAGGGRWTLAVVSRAANIGAAVLSDSWTVSVGGVMSFAFVVRQAFSATDPTLYDITIGAATNGRAVANRASAVVGSAVEIVAVADEGYVFDGWTAVTGITVADEEVNPLTFAMPAGDVAVTPTFVTAPTLVYMASLSNPTGAVTVSINGGTASATPAAVAVEPGAAVTYEMASLDSDYLFNGWTVVGGYTPYGFNAAANPLAFAMPNRDVEIAPNLTLNTFTLTATATTGGSVNPTSQSIVPGTEFSVTATPTAGYVFTGWTVVSGAAPTGFVATENPLTATMGSENLAVQANFALIPLYKITSVTAAAGITVTNGANAANARAGGVPAGTVVTLTASAAVGYTLIGFTVSGATDTDAAIGTVTFTMPSADVTVSTTSQLSARTVTATATTGGSVNPTSQSIVPGATFSIQATPSSGNQFYGWTVTGGTTPEGFVATENPLSATMGSENLSVQATFGPPLYKITASGMNLVFTYDANAEKARTTGVVAGTPITVTARPMNAFFTITSFAPFGGVTDTNSAIDVVSFVMPAQNVNIIGNASL